MLTSCASWEWIQVMQLIEVWKDIEGYEGLYMISSYGQVKSLDRFAIRKDGRKNHYPESVRYGHADQKGYLHVTLCKNGVQKTHLVHRLVAETFIPNPGNLPQVNHINEDKADNRVENLEWTSCIENIHHGTGIQRNALMRSVPVIRISPDGAVKHYVSASYAARAMGIVSQGIQNCCAGRQRTYKGYRWEYASKEA